MTTTNVDNNLIHLPEHSFSNVSLKLDSILIRKCRSDLKLRTRRVNFTLPSQLAKEIMRQECGQIRLQFMTGSCNDFPPSIPKYITFKALSKT